MIEKILGWFRTLPKNMKLSRDARLRLLGYELDKEFDYGAHNNRLDAIVAEKAPEIYDEMVRSRKATGYTPPTGIRPIWRRGASGHSRDVSFFKNWVDSLTDDEFERLVEASKQGFHNGGPVDAVQDASLLLRKASDCFHPVKPIETNDPPLAIEIIDSNDLAFCLAAQGAYLSETTLPSGKFIPKAPAGKIYRVRKHQIVLEDDKR